MANQGFMCTTGKEFRHFGTSIPLNVNFIQYSGNTEEILRDVFFLTTLAFTKPDDCSRFPLTTKITDIRLREVASEFNEQDISRLSRNF